MFVDHVSPIGRYGAWGLREYLGQPLNEAPKARAAVAYLSPAKSASK